MSGKNWKQNSGSGGMFHMPWEPLVASKKTEENLKKPKNSGALYHNYRGFFSIVILALVDGQYCSSDGWMWVQLDLAQMPRYLIPVT